MNKIVFASLLLVAVHSGAMDAPVFHSPENLQAKKFVDAIALGDMDELDALLDAGVDHTKPYRYFDGVHNKVRTPIMFAIMYYRPDMAQKLLAKDPEKQINGNESGTLMEYAAMKGSYECIPLLMSKGGQITNFVIQRASDPTYSSPQRSEKTLLVIKRYQKKGKGD